MGLAGKGVQIDCKKITGIMNSRKLRYVYILSGCDYLLSLPGIGLRKASDMVKERKNIKGILQIVQHWFPKEIGSKYGEKFVKADATFLYQFVFDPTSRTYVRLNPLPKNLNANNLPGLGKSPQNRNVRLLKSNNAIYLDHARILREANKENTDPFVRLTPSEFSKFKFKKNALGDMEVLLKKVERRFPPTSRIGPLTYSTNTWLSASRCSRPSTYQSGRKRKSSLDDWPEPVAKVRKHFALGWYL